VEASQDEEGAVRLAMRAGLNRPWAEGGERQDDGRLTVMLEVSEGGSGIGDERAVRWKSGQDMTAHWGRTFKPNTQSPNPG
jgi:hypothetical protein